MLRRHIFFLFFILFCVFQLQYNCVVGQNLILNGSFENYIRCPQNHNQYKSNLRDLVPGWNTVNRSTPDYFHRCSQNTDVGVPANFAGNIEPANGDAYVGLILRVDTTSYAFSPAYSEHITGTLEYPLVRGRTYCLRFFYAFGENSGISCSNLGIYFSQEKPDFSENNDMYSFQPQLLLHEDSILYTDGQWHLLSASFVASGGEKYMTIGNYRPLRQSMISKHHPEISNGTKFFAYYFFDAFELTESVDKKSCNKTALVSIVSDTMYEYITPNDSGEIMVFVPGKIYTLQNVFFDFEKADIRSEAIAELNMIVDFMNANTNLNIIVHGHTDAVGNENYNKLLSESRARAVFEYLFSQGIPVSRMKYVGHGSKMPVADNDTEWGRQQNRRVEIEFAVQ